jgi:NADH-quinone oxidoreductase subunit G
MCLVEMTKSPKPVVSCSLNIKNSLSGGNKIYTNSPVVKKSRENIMEFLLLNHPLDCPICDQGGECDLQDQSLFFGLAKKRFFQQKRFVHNKHLGIIVKTLMSRCIHCTRCIRFVSEIAGTEELGIFGRGSKSEIGTYILKGINTELAGNLIDICPVGALTSKPYPFIYRDWELKKSKTIDPSDGFGTDISTFIKNNIVVKILPGHIKEAKPYNPISWITDKTRFIFDGMLSQSKEQIKWNTTLKHILINIYLLRHLSKHKSKQSYSLVLIEDTLNIETLSFLLMLKHQSNFFKIRSSIKKTINNNIDFFFKTNYINDFEKLSKVETCLLVGTNTRYESPYLNIKIKTRNQKGNFRLFFIGSKINFTFPCLNIGSNIEKLRKICEGNTFFGIFFKKSPRALTLINTQTSQRWDGSTILNLLKLLNKTTTKSKKWHIFNFLHDSLNSFGFSYFYKFKQVSHHDFKHTDGLFLIGSNTRTISLIENYAENALLYNSDIRDRFVIEMNEESYFSDTFILFQKHYALKTSNFFETSGTFMTTQGLQKNVVKIKTAENNSKENWQIIRKIYNSMPQVEDIESYSKKLTYNTTSLLYFKSYINFIYKGARTLTLLTYYFSAKSQAFDTSIWIQKTKIALSQVKIGLKDFFIGGYDSYSRRSKIMINLSLNRRKDEVSFT